MKMALLCLSACSYNATYLSHLWNHQIAS